MMIETRLHHISAGACSQVTACSTWLFIRDSNFDWVKLDVLEGGQIMYCKIITRGGYEPV